MKRCIWLIVLNLVFGEFLSASDTAKQQEAITRLEQAVSKTNIFELPSFAMRADVQIEDHGKLVNGTYELLWNGPDQWREGISVPGYTEVQTGGKGTIWVQRSVDFIPASIYTLHQALGFGSSVGSPQSMSLVQLALTPRDTIKKTSKRKEHGDELTCFEIENEQKHSSEICVNDSSNTVARAPFMFADSNLQTIGAKIFPRLLTLHHGAEVVQHHQGTVSFDVLIGKDGVPQFRRLIESAGADLDDSSRRALSRWRYAPAMCNGQPVEVETVLQVNYALSY